MLKLITKNRKRHNDPIYIYIGYFFFCEINNKSYPSTRHGFIYKFIHCFAEPNTVSVRNSLDDWFKRRNLTQPVFETTEEAQGSKVTFSVKVSCSTPGEDNVISTLYECQYRSRLVSHTFLSFRLGRKHEICKRKAGQGSREKVQISP